MSNHNSQNPGKYPDGELIKKIIKSGDLMSIERVNSGIPGLDELINGGFPENSLILLSGSAGTGKSIFGLQYLCECARNGENGVYGTFEQSKESLITGGEQFRMGLEEFESGNKIRFVQYTSPSGAEDVYSNEEEKRLQTREKRFLEKLKENIDEIDARRVVIDSISGYMLYDGNKEALSRFIKAMRRLKTTTIVLAELKRSNQATSVVEYFEGCDTIEFLTDGVIVLNFTRVGPETGRYLMIEKMRYSKFDEDVHPIEFTEKGIRIMGLE